MLEMKAIGMSNIVDRIRIVHVALCMYVCSADYSCMFFKNGEKNKLWTQSFTVRVFVEITKNFHRLKLGAGDLAPYIWPARCFQIISVKLIMHILCAFMLS